MELPVPTHFRCPISLDLMRDPVTAPSGITYDRQSIETWLELGNWTCPVTGQTMLAEELIPNHSTRMMIQDWCVANHALGVERIPTPRIPVTPAEVAGILAEISAASQRGNHAGCSALSSRLKALGTESSRNRQCIVSAGAGHVLSAAFRELAGESTESPTMVGAWEQILSALVAFFPLDCEALRHVGSRGSLKSIVSILQSGDLAGRLTAALVLRELVTGLDPEGRDSMAKTSGLSEELVKLIEKPVSAQATKTTLVTLFLVLGSCDDSTASKLVQSGLVSILLALLVDSDKSTTERALGVLDCLFSCERGREEGRSHALTVPVLVKRVLRVSETATDFSVSALWKLLVCSGGGGGGKRGCIAEALQVGAFQKLLLLLQVGCGGRTKERASDLLKLLNGSRGSVECIETVDFKGLKRPF